MDIIEKLQNKPKKTRVLILWISSGFVMLVIILIWLFSFSGSNDSKDVSDDLEKTKLPSLFESMKQDFSIFKEKLSASFKEIKTKTEEVEQQSEE
jgi:hypothetical protein